MKIFSWFIGIFLTISTGYYVIGKYVFDDSSAFIQFVDTAIHIVGVCLNFLAQHYLAVLIVVAIAVILIFIFKMIVRKNSGDKE